MARSWPRCKRKANLIIASQAGVVWLFWPPGRPPAIAAFMRPSASVMSPSLLRARPFLCFGQLLVGLRELCLEFRLRWVLLAPQQEPHPEHPVPCLGAWVQHAVGRGTNPLPIANCAPREPAPQTGRRSEKRSPKPQGHPQNWRKVESRSALGLPLDRSVGVGGPAARASAPRQAQLRPGISLPPDGVASPRGSHGRADRARAPWRAPAACRGVAAAGSEPKRSFRAQTSSKGLNQNGYGPAGTSQEAQRP